MTSSYAARAPSKLPDGYDRWICIYPAYINKDKTCSEGRRIPKDKAVPGPTSKDIMEALSSTGLQFCGERKIYCREKHKEPQYWGRIRVQLKSENGEIINENFKTREDVLLYTASKIFQIKKCNPKVSHENQQQGKQGKGKKKR